MSELPELAPELQAPLLPWAGGPVCLLCAAPHHMASTGIAPTLCFLYLQWLKIAHSVENTFTVTPVISLAELKQPESTEGTQ